MFPDPLACRHAVPSARGRGSNPFQTRLQARCSGSTAPSASTCGRFIPTTPDKRDSTRIPSKSFPPPPNNRSNSPRSSSHALSALRAVHHHCVSHRLGWAVSAVWLPRELASRSLWCRATAARVLNRYVVNRLRQRVILTERPPQVEQRVYSVDAAADSQNVGRRTLPVQQYHVCESIALIGQDPLKRESAHLLTVQTPASPAAGSSQRRIQPIHAEVAKAAKGLSQGPKTCSLACL